ncbi:sensor histidine kinase/response regulator [Alcanivorax hongdengensis A-11-3]|uniref:Sensor histidine kinase/response regulator n=1 Tax=Alcanivorax hongdengensis A-11-3 TaxID=1177179 RepID=L0WFY9_9GAMM|nr:GAF domain-containing protein [Alcanivorax hongdengensis]EKF75067.1 sensor histidine kinase/response regulator [Alcanivorax hongdengensis A-11-3]
MKEQRPVDLTPQEEALLRERSDTLLVRLKGRLEEAYKVHAENRAASLIHRSVYLLLGIYLLVILPVMLIVQTEDMVRWRSYGVYPVALALALLWCSGRIPLLSRHVTTAIGVAVMIALAGTLLGAIYLDGTFAGTVASFESIYILIIAFSILRLPPSRTLLWCGLALVLALVMALARDIPIAFLDLLLCFLVPLCICGVNGYMLDASARRNFANTLLLEQESKHMAAWKEQVEQEHAYQQHINRFMEEIAGNLNSATLLERVLGYLVHHTEARVAAAYEVQGDCLARLAGWGLNAEAAEQRQRIPLNEGLLGGALQSDAISTQNNLPPGYLDMETGQGRYPCAALLFWPIHHAGQPLGIIELAAQHPFSEEQQRFISRLHRPLAYALVAAQRRQQFLDAAATPAQA